MSVFQIVIEFLNPRYVRPRWVKFLNDHGRRLSFQTSLKPSRFDQFVSLIFRTHGDRGPADDPPRKSSLGSAPLDRSRAALLPLRKPTPGDLAFQCVDTGCF